jgi:hypothetical protein
LEMLAHDGNAEVRLATATNPSTPVDITYMLAYDPDPTVRHGIAEDATVPIGVLKILNHDENPYVACRARKTLEQLFATRRESGPCQWRDDGPKDSCA